ncbi:MAG: hypothetical protein HQ504_12400 [Rhodospirillaceae bacterium]|nr:hypothetical protein [Rhodospirillaceae bacterium]
MKRLGFTAFFVAIFSIVAAVKPAAAEDSAGAYLEILRSPPNRHVITMTSMEKCQLAAEHSNARCISRLPRLPDSSTGEFRSLKWAPKPVAGVVAFDPNTVLKGKDFGPVYMVLLQSPPNRHVIAMASMKKCLEAVAFTSATCVEKLPRLPDLSTGRLRSLKNSAF